MDFVLVIGGGLAGCTAALELAENNREVVIVEKSAAIGGAVRQYGCLATDRCNNCGLCLVGDLWKRVKEHRRIKILNNSQVKDIRGTKGNYQAVLKSEQGIETLGSISSIIVAIGFDKLDAKLTGSFESGDFNHVITGRQLDQLCADRNRAGLFKQIPQSVAFIQCYGSRDVKQKAAYCSRVCCSYSTRAAKVLQSYYPEMRIVFFYMDLQQVEAGEYFASLAKLGIEFIRCRPVRFKANSPGTVLYEKPGYPEMIEEKFDFIILSEGIHPASDGDRIAEICNLGLDEAGFLKYVTNSNTTGIYIVGCVSGPKKIEETYMDALQAAREIILARAATENLLVQSSL
jgi:heterodisulfide reductase subunit A